jgi:hypothetical protein
MYVEVFVLSPVHSCKHALGAPWFYKFIPFNDGTRVRTRVLYRMVLCSRTCKGATRPHPFVVVPSTCLAVKGVWTGTGLAPFAGGRVCSYIYVFLRVLLLPAALIVFSRADTLRNCVRA